MNRIEIERIMRKYSASTRIRLISMDDPQSPPSGTAGIVITVDALGNLIMAWDNGSGLNICPEIDRFEVISSGAEEASANG